MKQCPRDVLPWNLQGKSAHLSQSMQTLKKIRHKNHRTTAMLWFGSLTRYGPVKWFFKIMQYMTYFLLMSTDPKVVAERQKHCCSLHALINHNETLQQSLLPRTMSASANKGTGRDWKLFQHRNIMILQLDLRWVSRRDLGWTQMHDSGDR